MKIRIPANVALLAGVEASTPAKDFCEKVKDLYHKYFPNSAIYAVLQNHLGYTIIIDPHICKTKSECINGILQNDPMNIRFVIYLDKNFNEDSPLPEKMTLEVLRRTFVTIPDDRYSIYGIHKFAFRKSSGSDKKILVTLDKYFKMMKEDIKNLLKENKIHKDHLELVQSKIS